MPLLELAGMSVAVTGADGFIGSRVVAALEESGARVRRFTSPGFEQAGGISSDLRDIDQVRPHLDDVDTVIHLAARAGGVQFQEGTGTDVLRDNTEMTQNVLSAAVAAGVRRVFLASSAVVYSAHAGADLVEDSPLVAPGREPVSPYAWSKLTDEVMGSWFRDADIEVVIGRFTNVFGRGATFDEQRSTVIHALVKKAVDAGPGGRMEVWGDGRAVRTFIHVSDAAKAVLHVAVDGEDGEAYNLSASPAVRISEVVEIVRELVDPAMTVRFDTSAPSGSDRRVLDASKLEGLGFQPRVSLTDGIRDVVAGYRSAQR